jgi:peptidyl-prolyl cis-trans isomerase B (cyclophilin B)
VPTTGRGLLALAVLALGVVTACGGSSSGGGATVQATSTTPAASTPAQAGQCGPVPNATPSQQQFDKEPPVTIQPTTYTATLTTNCGTIVLALDGKAAPHTVNSFAFLASKHFFDNTPCHRLTTQGIYVLQCGDPTGTGSGGPGYSIPDENLKHAKYPAGTVAMANAGPNTGGSQFFLVYADTKLDNNYTPFGRVVKGMDVLRAIARKGSDNSNGQGDGAPVQPVVIESFTVAKSG